MVVTVDGKNRIRDLVNTDVSSMELGTDGTSATETDTGLGTGVPATNKVPTVEVTNKTLTLTHTLTTAEGNGITFKEGAVFLNADAVMLDRFVFPDFAKTSAEELTTIDVIRID